MVKIYSLRLVILDDRNDLPSDAWSGVSCQYPVEILPLLLFDLILPFMAGSGALHIMGKIRTLLTLFHDRVSPN